MDDRRIVLAVTLVGLLLFAAGCVSVTPVRPVFSEPSGSPTWPVTARAVLYYFGTPT